MERNYNNRDFEQYVKKNADQYRMIPSEKVWKGINNALHTRRRWYGIGLVLLLLLTGISVTWVMLSYPGSGKQLAAAGKPAITDNKKKVPPTSVSPIQPIPSTAVSDDIASLFSVKKFDIGKTVLTPTGSLVISTEQAGIGRISTADIAVKNRDGFMESGIPATSIALIDGYTPLSRDNSIFDGYDTKGDFSLYNTDSKRLLHTPSASEKSRSNQNAIYLPLTIESVVNSYKSIRLPKKILWQLYFTPTFSYRRLSANKSFKNAGPFAEPILYPFTALTDVNRAVTHKPDMGLQLGFAARYPASKNLKIRVGMQFNINRYDIKAYMSNGEQATINLSGDNNSVTAWTYYRNYNGYKSDWLKNYYLSVSVPLGAEFTIFGNNKTSFGVAGAVQPTYILRDRAYLISTDYKNYAKVPWLVRRTNINTSFETFVNFTSRNKTKWQIGPQVRYQVLSSFHNQYPVAENLFDFGLKMGVTLNK